MEHNNKLDSLNRLYEIDHQLKKLGKEKKEIQDKCFHKVDGIIKFDESNILKVYCCDCYKELRYPTKEEQDNFLNNGNTRVPTANG